MLAIQYDLFEDNSEVQILRKEILAVRASSENVRRGMFSRHSELSKMLMKQQEEIESLRSMLLRLKK
ncbi:MAG: hypothetical protein Q8876_05655 [Bacillota bacterium]|nr:hypothetical protein [Bacillota bacterium]